MATRVYFECDRCGKAHNPVEPNDYVLPEGCYRVVMSQFNYYDDKVGEKTHAVCGDCFRLLARAFDNCMESGDRVHLIRKSAMKRRLKVEVKQKPNKGGEVG